MKQFRKVFQEHTENDTSAFNKISDSFTDLKVAITENHSRTDEKLINIHNTTVLIRDASIKNAERIEKLEKSDVQLFSMQSRFVENEIRNEKKIDNLELFFKKSIKEIRKEHSDGMKEMQKEHMDSLNKIQQHIEGKEKTT
jgi:hypothetical protein